MKTQDLKYEVMQTGAIFGREQGLKVVFEGEQAYTDGKEIVLPAIPDNTIIKDTFARVTRGYLDHEAGHVRHTNFDTLLKFREGSSKNLWGLHNQLEDIWLEKRVMDEYPGAAKNLKELTDYINPIELEFAKKNIEGNPEISWPSVSLGIAVDGRKDYSDLPLNREIWDTLPERIKAWAPKWNEALHKCKNTGHVCALTKEISKLIKEDPDLSSDPEEFKFDPETGEGESFEGSGNGPEEKDDLGKLNPADWGEGRDSKDDIEKADEELNGRKTFGKRMAEDLKSTTDGAYEDPDWKSKGYKVLSNRWDAEIHVNKPQPYKTRVGDLMANKTSADYEQLKTQIRSHVTTMKSKLRRAISAKEQRDWDFGRSSGKIDSKRLAQAFQGAENVYKKRIDRDELDTAVLVLVDLSGSMGGAKQHTAGLSAIAFAECLEGTQVKYQVSGFSNNIVGSIRGEVTKLVSEAKGSWHRYEPLQVYTFKDFNDKLHPQKGAMAALTEAAGGNNSDTDAIIWAHQKLKKMPQKRKILIVLSDGYPANDDIGNPGSLYTPLKKAAEDVAKDGIECIGIGILSDSCQNLYKNNVRVDNIEELSGVVFTKLSAILMGAKLKL